MFYFEILYKKLKLNDYCFNVLLICIFRFINNFKIREKKRFVKSKFSLIYLIKIKIV